MSVLAAKQIKLSLQAVPHWSKSGQTIRRKYKFEDFIKAMDFVNQIAIKAQKMNHHPDIDIRFNKVTLKLTTQDENGLTKKDFSLAKQCDENFSKKPGRSSQRITKQIKILKSTRKGHRL